MLDGAAVNELLELTKNEEDSTAWWPSNLKGKSFRYSLNFRFSLLGRYAALHKKAELLVAAKGHLAAYPSTFDAGNV